MLQGRHDITRTLVVSVLNLQMSTLMRRWIRISKDILRYLRFEKSFVVIIWCQMILLKILKAAHMLSISNISTNACFENTNCVSHSTTSVAANESKWKCIYTVKLSCGVMCHMQISTKAKALIYTNVINSCRLPAPRLCLNRWFPSTLTPYGVKSHTDIILRIKKDIQHPYYVEIMMRAKWSHQNAHCQLVYEKY